MSNKNKNAFNTANIDWITTHKNQSCPSMGCMIESQLESSMSLTKNLLQELEPGVFLLTIALKNSSSLMDIKKLSDLAQYSLISEHCHNSPIIKLSFNSLRNLCHEQDDCRWAQTLSTGSYQDLHVVFFYHLARVEQAWQVACTSHQYAVEPLGPNHTLSLSDNTFNYRYRLTRLAALILWRETSLANVISEEIIRINSYFSLFPKLYSCLHHSHPTSRWELESGHMRYTQGGISKNFDYQSLAEDIIGTGYQDNIPGFIKSFKLSDLDCAGAFPTLSVRSLVYLKARPNTLSSLHNGYAVCAAKEYSGKQSPIETSIKDTGLSYQRWLSRSARYVGHHHYQARLIFAPGAETQAFSLVGEQVASIAIFPKLIKGVLEQLNIPQQNSVRLIAHNEDVLTIATDLASWNDINELNKKASLLFKMVSADGRDPLSLFEQVLLPNHGAGNFNLSLVPNEFFELLETAHTMHSLPPGHNHYLLGLAYECLHEWGLAVSELQKALRKDSSDPDILSALGSALMEIGQIPEALPFLKRAFDLLPEDAELANNLGKSNLECGQINDAIKAFERAVSLSPASADFLANLGNGYLLAARTSEALDMLKKAVRCNPHFAPAHESLAHLYLKDGNEKLAKEHALLAYKENPVDTNIANLLWRLTVGKGDQHK